jgi:phage tail-like protein
VIIWGTLTINGAELPGFFKIPSIESGIDPSQLSLVAGKPLTLPKGLTPPSLTIAREIDNDLTLSKWHEAALRGDPSAPADVVFTGFDYQGRVVATWHLVNAWPSKYETGLGDTQSTEIVTIVGEKMERVG